MDHSIISKATLTLAQRIQENSPTPLTQRQAIRRAVWFWELERTFQECQPEIRQKRADTTAEQ